MSLGNMAVQVDESKANADRLKAAVDLATRHGSHLVGCYTLRTLNPVIYSSGTALSGVYEDAMESIEADARAAEAAFREAVANLESTEWRSGTGLIAANLVEAARYCELTVVGQFDPDDEGSPGHGVPETVALEAGRPVLVIPYIGAPHGVGRRVLVAWNGTREAARAVNDAMPFLRDADRVDVLYLSTTGSHTSESTPASQLRESLRRSGVANVEAHTLVVESGEVGDALLSRVSDLESDLVVMGAYGHSRFREMVLGGATDSLLRHMTVPVLMSH